MLPIHTHAFTSSHSKVPMVITHIDHHRNGVGGAPFDVVHFTAPDDDENIIGMIAVVFEEKYHTAVLEADPDKKTKWRGDVFDAPLRAAIKKFKAHNNRFIGT